MNIYSYMPYKAYGEILYIIENKKHKFLYVIKYFNI